MQFFHDTHQKLSYFKTSLFPHSFREKGLRNRALIGVGGNIGDVKRRFDKLVHFLQMDAFIGLVQSSIIVKNPPFGFTQQAFFYNTVLVIETNLNAHALLRHLLRIEKRFGRKRSFANAPRTLDLDILFFNDEVISTKTLNVPHPAWQERNSVTIPLYYLG